MSYPRIETSLREARSYEHNLLITYDCQTGEFRYPSFYTGKRSEHRPIWKLLLEDGFATEQVAENIRKKIEELAASDKPQVFYTEYYLRNLNLELVGITAFMLACAALSFVVGLALANRLAHDRAHFVAVSFCCGIRNVSAGAVLAAQHFGPEVMFPAVIGTLFQQVLAALFGRVMERELERSRLA
jgi:hypothetical protein